ncbi:hypothetical protein ABRT01_09245 [Lentibacillus sp. L22]|uniref:phasin family protein n=1 Tax=Lentibacillus TaxID=175304 RepID=UPI0022B1DE65|nr:hypothetical protein [Lentibacillus daqui]
MGDLLRKGFLLGLGAAVSGKEKLEEKLKDLVDKNELTQEQARTVMNNFIEKGESKKSEWSTKQQNQTEKMLKDLGIATKEDMEVLRSRINDLEEKIGK